MRTKQPRALESYSKQGSAHSCRKVMVSVKAQTHCMLRLSFLPTQFFFYFSVLPVICCFYGPDHLLCDWTCVSPKVSWILLCLPLRHPVSGDMWHFSSCIFRHPTTTLRAPAVTDYKLCFGDMGWQQYSLRRELRSPSSSSDCISPSPVHGWADYLLPVL